MNEALSGHESELCPHGKLPGICAECLKTEGGEARRLEIREKAKEIGSSKAKELWRSLEAEGKDPKDFIYDVTMVLGAGFRKEEEGFHSDRLNIESRMRLNAAAQLYHEGRSRIICVTGGSAMSEEWREYGSLAEVGKKYLMEKFDIPKEDIILEGKSDATHGNLAHGLREMYRESIPVGRFAILSTNYHLNRAREMATRSGIKADLLPAESLLLRASKHYRKFVENWLVYAQNAGMEENEIAKLRDNEYWEKRAAFFETPLDEEVENIDISADVAKTAQRLSEAGAEGVQTGAF